MLLAFVPQAIAFADGQRPWFLTTGGYSESSSMKCASGGKVCHLESRLRLRFTPRSSGQITFAFGFSVNLKTETEPVCQTQHLDQAKVCPPAGPPEAQAEWVLAIKYGGTTGVGWPKRSVPIYMVIYEAET